MLSKSNRRKNNLKAIVAVRRLLQCAAIAEYTLMDCFYTRGTNSNCVKFTPYVICITTNGLANVT